MNITEKITYSEEQIENTPTNNPYLIPAAIIVAGAIIGASVIFANTATRRSGINALTAADNQRTETANVAGAAVTGDLQDDDPSLGDSNAPVTIVEFGDFQCPFCQKFFQSALPQIKSQYVTTGKARLVYRDFPLPFHPMAQPAAEAAECANEQGKFWQYHDYIFGHQSELSETNLKAWAATLGLDAARFNGCVDSHKYAAEIKKDAADGQKAGVSGTPSTFINGRLIVGAVPFEQFQQIIEEELKKSQSK